MRDRRVTCTAGRYRPWSDGPGDQWVDPAPDDGPADRDGVPAELVAQRGDGLHRRGVSCREANRANSAAAITGIGTALAMRLLDGPAALAGVVDVALDRRPGRVLLERLDQQVEQPGPDDGAAASRP